MGLVSDETFVTAWSEWSRYKRFGLPHGRGWRAERPQWVRAIEAIDQEFELYQSEEIKRARSR
jgi:hypothetical protein